MRETYHTRQQDELLSILEQTPGTHYTAARLHELLAQRGQPVGLVTIYRRLDRMAAEGTVRRYKLETGGSACYEYTGPRGDCSSHFHCKCEQCGRLIHLDCSQLKSIQDHIMDNHGFEWNTGKTVFYGICERCRKA